MNCDAISVRKDQHQLMKLGDNVKKETRLTEKQKKISGKRHRQLCGVTLSEDIVDDYCQEHP